jgi:transcriptional regulator with XRE-family HTH domain
MCDDAGLVLDPVEIGSRIRLARLQAGLTQEDLGDAIDMSTRQVQHYEAGTAPQAVTLKLRDIAAATSTTVGWLVGNEDLASGGRIEALEAEIKGLREDLDRLVEEQKKFQNKLLRLIGKGRRDSAQGGARVA